MRISDWSSDVCSSDLPIPAVEVISEAIKKADSSYFFENYNKQAAAVLAALKQHGYTIVPYYPTVEMVKAAMDELQYRSEERRVGKECVSRCRSRWSPYHKKKKKNR